MNKEKEPTDKSNVKKEKKPDETGGFHIEGHIKIFDPKSNEIFRNIRG